MVAVGHEQIEVVDALDRLGDGDRALGPDGAARDVDGSDDRSVKRIGAKLDDASGEGMYPDGGGSEWSLAEIYPVLADPARFTLLSGVP